MDIEIREDERLDDLQFKGLRIIQNIHKFRFGTDAVLLSHFADIRRGDRVMDLGTGSGIIPILLSGICEDSKIHGLEIQSDMVDMARRSVRLNKLENRIEIMQGDIKTVFGELGRGQYSLVVTNPPYKKAGSGIVSKYDAQAVARHEILCTLKDVLSTASSLLVNGGRFAMVHQTDRMADIIYEMRNVKLEPKRIQLVHPNKKKPPNIVLIEGVRNGKPHLKWMPPLFVYNSNGDYTRDLKEIYNLDDNSKKS
jgi:tRNA1Val (adenine37-N6)-methyltransferase